MKVIVTVIKVIVAVIAAIVAVIGVLGGVASVIALLKTGDEGIKGFRREFVSAFLSFGERLIKLGKALRLHTNDLLLLMSLIFLVFCIIDLIVINVMKQWLNYILLSLWLIVLFYCLLRLRLDSARVLKVGLPLSKTVIQVILDRRFSFCFVPSSSPKFRGSSTVDIDGELDDFYISKYPITNKQYKLFVDRTKRPRPPANWDQDTRSCPNGQDDHPVHGISFDDAEAYCNWLSRTTGVTYRLPTELEWEKAAFNGLPYPWGDRYEDGRCNSAEASIRNTTPVNAYRSGRSPYRCWDMLGNVFEWTRGINENEYCVISGSSYREWISSCLERPYPFRASCGKDETDYIRDIRDTRSKSVGFRIVREATYSAYWFVNKTEGMWGMSDLSENLKKLRTALGRKQKKVAKALGIRKPIYSSWEDGSTEPSTHFLIELAGYFKVSVDRLVYPPLRIGSWYQKFSGFHPIKNNKGFYSLIYPLVYGRPFLFDIYDRRFHTEIAVADSLRANRSELSYTFCIRSDFRFHNGRRLEPDDVKFSYDEFLKANKFYSQFFDYVMIEREKNAIKLKLRKWLELNDLPAPYIIPAPGEKAPDDYYYDGCGPYKIARGSREDLKKDFDKPIYLESSIYYPSEEPFGIQAMELRSFSSIEELRDSLYRGKVNFAVDLAEDRRFNVEYGFSDISYYLVLKQNREICKNINFRRAVNCALDRSLIIEKTKALLNIKRVEFLPNRYLYNLLPESLSQEDIGGYNSKAAREYWETAKTSLADTVFSVASAHSEEQDTVASSLVNELVNEIVKELQAMGIKCRREDNPLEADAVVQVVKFDSAEFIYLNLCSSESERLWGYTSPDVRGLLASDDGMVRGTYEKIQDFMTSEGMFVPLLRRGKAITYTKDLNTKFKLQTPGVFYGPHIIQWEFR